MNLLTSDELSYAGTDCSNPSVNAYYVGVHAISPTKYESMIRAYFNNTHPTEKQVDPSELDVSSCSCDDYVEFDTHGTDRDNADLDVAVVFSMLKIGKYSVHFFKGLTDLFTPLRYEFSKARDASGDTVVIRVIMLVDSVETVVYHGDLTNMYP